MAGVTSASMYMHIVKNAVHGNVAYTNLSEQLAKILRMGANDQSVIDRLVWMRDVFGPMLKQAVEITGEIDLRSMLAQALHMGDEDHNRNIAGTLLFFQSLASAMLQTDFTTEQKKEVFDFIASSDYFSGPTWMAVSKCAMDAAHGVPNSTVVTTMCRNGTDFGLRVSNFEGFRWFTGPAQQVIGPMMGGYKPEDSGLDIGDSAITETYGIGGFAMAAAPAIVKFVGGDVPFALEATQRMYGITEGEHTAYTVPILEFRGTPTGIDVTKVVRTGILPQINTGMAGAVAGVGQVGAGLVTPPVQCFPAALASLARRAEL
jgi:hypothetical protein